MQGTFDSLERFNRSSLCVFDFKPIDYPTQLQQHLITNYFAMADLLKTHSRTDIVRLLHSSEKYLEVFIPGLLYQMLLDPVASEQHFEAYMPSLRSESWSQFGKLLLVLLKDSFLWIKAHLRIRIIPLLTKLHYYGQLIPDLVILAIKTIDYSDFSENGLNYNNEMMALFHRLLSEPVSKPLSYLLAKALFYKLLRMLSLLVCVEDEALREYKTRCVGLAERLFELERSKCLSVANSGMNIFRELEKEELLTPLLSRFTEALNVTEIQPQSPQSASMRLSAVLPIKTETTLLFIIEKGISKMEINIQLNWSFAQSKEYGLFLTMDILRYILALTPDDIPIKVCLDILEWLFYRVCSNNVLFQLWKDELFFPCFAYPCPFPAAPERVMRFLAHILQVDIDFGETLLIYLLHHRASNRPQVLRSLLLKANELQILDLNGLILHSRVRPRIKQELSALMGQSALGSRSTNEQSVTYYDLLEPMNRKDSEMSMEFSDSDHNYLESPEEITPIEQQVQKVEAGKVSMGRVRLEKMFVEDMGEALAHLLASPCLETFKQCYRHLLTVTKQFRVSGQQALTDGFLCQLAKVLYLMFQNEFEEHQQLYPKQQSLIFYFLNSIALEWRTNSFQLQIAKKIVKKLIELFPTCEPTFWRYFLTYFKRSVVGSSREVKQWLIPREKVEFAVGLLRELGPLSRQLTENAEQLKLPFTV